MDDFMSKYKLQDMFPFIDNSTICGKDQNDHDKNFENFEMAAKSEGLTMNKDKCTYSATTLDFLGYHISYNTLSPDPERLAPLLNLPTPTDQKSLKCIADMFSYTKWISKFSDKIYPLNNVLKFPLNSQQVKAFESLKVELANAAIQVIDENIPFTVETGALDFAISATLNQDGRPVAFYSHMLQGSEQYHSSVEKEAQAIIESIHRWRHFLLGRHFTLITDQRSVAFMYKVTSKIKNDKIMRWRIALSHMIFTITQHPATSLWMHSQGYTVQQLVHIHFMSYLHHCAILV
ncbi:Hypothetical predicted protein [Octopus vulgaris]|uniref:Reverse transcriptase domain-containing protein n=1 Tax=Octopus vulgaris TaxID=6645 RepID=A0AA36ASM7_OCTVU|nr:Hypothetical predicted protein [Octopus vulgaris]